MFKTIVLALDGPDGSAVAGPPLGGVTHRFLRIAGGPILAVRFAEG